MPAASGRAFARIPEAMIFDTNLSAGAVRLWAALDRYANASREAWPSTRALAKRLGVGDSSVRRWIDELTTSGWLTRHERKTEQGASRTALLVLANVGAGGCAADGAPQQQGFFDVEGCVADDAGGAPLVTQGAPPAAPHSIERESVERKPVNDTVPAAQRRRAHAREKVGGKVLHDDERQAAQLILDAFNARAGTRFSLTARTLVGIVLRMRENPELGIADHAAIIDCEFGSPWWKRAPSPAVIYGNESQFETARERWRRRVETPARPAISERLRRVFNPNPRERDERAGSNGGGRLGGELLAVAARLD